MDESEDEDDEYGLLTVGGVLRTDHEEPEPPVEPPPISAFPAEAGELHLLGHVHNKIGNVAVIQSAFHSEHHVLDSGTLVGLNDRTVIGSIFETFGPLAKPYFSVRFPSDQTPTLTALEIHQPVVFCPANPNFATLLKTLDVRALGKGSDASNVFDEEPAAHELEFSDDEAEQAHKRSLKKARQDHHREPSHQSQQHSRYYPGGGDGSVQADVQDLPYEDDASLPPTTPASAPSESRPVASYAAASSRGKDSRDRGGRGRGRGRDNNRGRPRDGGGSARGGRGRDRGGRCGRGRDRDFDRSAGSYHPQPPRHPSSYAPQGAPLQSPRALTGNLSHLLLLHALYLARFNLYSWMFSQDQDQDPRDLPQIGSTICIPL